MAYILDSKGKAVPATSWEEYATWWFEHKDALVIATSDVRDRKNRYITTVRTHFHGSTEKITEVWITEADGLSKTAETQEEALENHKRCVKYIENCHCK